MHPNCSNCGDEIESGDLCDACEAGLCTECREEPDCGDGTGLCPGCSDDLFFDPSTR